MSVCVEIRVGDCRELLRAMPDESVQCVVTSPPYWGLRDYGCAGQIGLEASLPEFLAELVSVFDEVCRILKKDGTCWVNIGDSYGRGSNGFKPKDIVGQPWRLAFALQESGWYLRQDIIWSKSNPMPESVKDRCTKAHEYLFLLSKSEHYHFDSEAIAEPAIYGDRGSSFESDRKTAIHPNTGKKRRETVARGGFRGKTNALAGREAFRAIKDWRNKRSVWTIPTFAFSEAHFATYPPDLVKPCILAGTRPGDTVLDPFGGSGTTGMVALELGRSAILLELNPEYAALARQRCNVTPGLYLV